MRTNFFKSGHIKVTQITLLTLLSLFQVSCRTTSKNSTVTADAYTTLTIIQEEQQFKITKSGTTVVLKKKPFILSFNSGNTEAVFLHASTDSVSFSKAVHAQFNRLQCFNSEQTFSEPSKNADREILVTNEEHGGYHCLFAKAEKEFIRFDKVQKISGTNWIGIRSVKQITFLEPSRTLPCEQLGDQTIYLTYSAGKTDFGEGVRLKFE